MNAGLIMRALAASNRGGAPLVWESCAALLDRLPENRDVVAALPPGGYLARLLRARVTPRHLFLHPASESGEAGTVGEGVEPALLGDADTDPCKAPALPWPAPQAAASLPNRRADTLYRHSHAPGLLVLGGCRQAEILRGAARLLAAHAPMLLLDFSAVPHAARADLWEDCVRACPAGENAWHDSLLMPCASARQRRDCVAAIGHAAGIYLPSSAAPESALPPGIAALLENEALELAALSWAGAADKVARHHQAREGAAIRLDASVPTQGFHPPEGNAQGGFWRWTGPGPAASFTLPLPGPGPWRLRLDVANWGAARQPGSLRASVHGAFLPIERQDEQCIVFAPLAPPPFWSGAPLRIDLTTPRPPPASAQDPRCLGVCLSQAAVTPL
jgi:hypothetical protein